MAALRCGYWNIHGHKSKMVGNKFCDPDFLKLLSDRDIIGIGEIQSASEVSIPGFVNLKQKIREKKIKGPKIAGGMGVFVREDIAHLVQVVPNNNDDSIWIKIKTHGLNEMEKIYLGTYYVSPYNKSRKDYDFFTEINEEITYFRKKGTVLVQGDLNARFGREQEYIEPDKSDAQFGVESPDTHSIRNSEDQNKNTRGNELLDICKLNDMLIVNGRRAGDI